MYLAEPTFCVCILTLLPKRSNDSFHRLVRKLDLPSLVRRHGLSLPHRLLRVVVVVVRVQKEAVYEFCNFGFFK